VLIALLRTFLRRYRRELFIVVALTFVQTMCTLLLPALNADIIDKGIITGDTDYIWRVGGLMLLITFVQVAFAITAVYFGARVAMAFGRDVRKALFHRVTDFSAQDVASYGAPSLITRITNDVTQVQILVLMSCTLLIAAPFTVIGGVILAVREDAVLSLLLLVAIPVLLTVVGFVISRMVPQYQVMQTRLDRINEILREQITGIRVVRAFVREPDERRSNLDRREAHRRRRHADRRHDCFPQLPDPDSHVRDDGHFRRGARATRCRERGADQGRARRRDVGRRADGARHPARCRSVARVP
jgi:ATP-binding cassette subfamily B protein